MRYCHRFLRLGCFTLILIAGCAGSSPRPAVVVEAAYPGANAQVVADVVAAPIEQQVIGVEKLLSMRSRCTSDGRYVLTLTFEDGIDAAMTQVLVQNRVALAQPLLPQLVVRAGLTVKTKPVDVLLIVSLSSPEGHFDGHYLGNLAAVQLKDEFARLPGVGGVAQLPELNQGLRVWLDRKKLAACDMTAADVSHALKAQNLDGENFPPIGENDARIDFKTMGRLLDEAEFGDIIVKNAGARVIRLRDVARVEPLSKRPQHSAQLNGKDVALLVIAPTSKARPRELTLAVTQKLEQLEKHLPKGLRLELAFDFTANLETPEKRGIPEYLLLDLDLHDDAAPERAATVLGRCEKVVRDVDGVKDVLTLSDNPVDGAFDRPCVLVRLAPTIERKSTREEIAATIRTRLHEKVADATARLRTPLGAGLRAGWGYPLDLAVSGPEPEPVRKLAAKLAERMRQEKKLTDVWLDLASELRPQLDVHVDREKARKLGVKLEDIFATLELAGAAPEKGREMLKGLKIRNAQGEMVALSAIVTTREIAAASAINRLDMQPMVQITANPTAGTSVADARALCETLFRAIREELALPAAYRLNP